MISVIAMSGLFFTELYGDGHYLKKEIHIVPAGREFSALKVDRRVHKSPPLHPNPNSTSHLVYSISILIISFYLRLGLPAIIRIIFNK